MKTFQNFLREMSLRSMRTDLRHVPKDDEGFYEKPDGTRDTGNQIFRPNPQEKSQPQIGGYFSKKDRAVITHPRTMRALESRLAGSGYEFNILFLEDASRGHAADYGRQVKDFMADNGIQGEGHITFVKNGTSGHVLTPWMILHTLGHALTEHADHRSAAKFRIREMAIHIMSLVSETDCKSLGNRSPRCLEALGKVLAFKSASRRDDHSTAGNLSELVHELVAEFLWNGDRIRIKPPYDKDQEVAGLVRDIEGEVRTLLDNCVGKIVYDYYDG
jgi:hypothetical protein